MSETIIKVKRDIPQGNQEFEIVTQREDVERFTISQLDSQIDGLDKRLAELKAKKAKALELK